jgi:nucleotide sugar dehydrogenase
MLVRRWRSNLRAQMFQCSDLMSTRLRWTRSTQGRSYIRHIGSETIAEVVKEERLCASTDFSRVQEVEAVVICVPTPLNKNREPDISFILETGRAIAPHLTKRTLVVLESTTYPGTTDENLRKVLEDGSGMTAGTDFHLAFSPEREDPGNDKSKVRIVAKVIGGYTPARSGAPTRFTARRSRRSCRSALVAWPKQRSCSKTSFVVSISLWLMS